MKDEDDDRPVRKSPAGFELGPGDTVDPERSAIAVRVQQRARAKVISFSEALELELAGEAITFREAATNLAREKGVALLFPAGAGDRFQAIGTPEARAAFDIEVEKLAAKYGKRRISGPRAVTGGNDHSEYTSDFAA